MTHIKDIKWEKMTLKQKDDFAKSLDGLNSWAIWEIVGGVIKSTLEEERKKLIAEVERMRNDNYSAFGILMELKEKFVSISYPKKTKSGVSKQDTPQDILPELYRIRANMRVDAYGLKNRKQIKSLIDKLEAK